MVGEDATGLKLFACVGPGDRGLWVGDFGTKVRELFDDDGLEGALLEYPSHWCPNLTQRRQLGLVSSHLTRRILIVWMKP